MTFHIYLTTYTLNNELFLTSIFHCPPSNNLNIYSTIHFINGIQKLTYLNFSQNSLYQYPIYLQDCSSFIGLYNNIEGNRPIHSYTIYFHGGSSIRKINYTNIIKNTSPNGGVIYSVNTPYDFYKCFFEKNFNWLFQGYLSIRDSWISHNSELLYPANYVNFYGSNCQNSEGCLTEKHIISHLSTAVCQTETPAPSKTPNIEELNLTPCNTLPPLPTPPQTIPLSPTICLIESNSGNINLKLINLFLIKITIL